MRVRKMSEPKEKDNSQNPKRNQFTLGRFLNILQGKTQPDRKIEEKPKKK